MGPWLDADRRPIRDDRTRSDGSRGSGSRRTDRAKDDDGQRAARRDRPPRLRHVRRDARDPGRRSIATAWSGSAPARTSTATTSSSCTPTASTAPTSPTSPGSTRASRRRCSSSARPASRPSWSATSATAWPERLRCAMRRHLFQDFSLPGQPRDRSRSLAEILAAEGIREWQPGRGDRLEGVRRPRRRSKCRRSSSTSCAG